MATLRSIIIDDELHCIETLQWQLEEYCPEVEIAAVCSSGKEGITAIERLQPDIIFLDIEMPYMNAFEMLEQLETIDFGIIFTTAYDEYAIRAFKVSALDYLMKPIDKDELLKAVKKAVSEQQAEQPSDFQQIELLMENIRRRDQASFKRAAFPTLEGFELVETKDIVRCQSDSNYTMVFLKDGKKLTVSRTLKQIEEMLDGQAFFRVHHSHLVNMNHVSKYVRGDGGYLIMTDNSDVNVARSRKDKLLEALGR